MPGTNAGTGQPISARCSQCKISGHRHRQGYKLKATNRKLLKPSQRGKPGPRMSRTHSYEYECMDCGHVGWSRHLDLEHQYNRVAGITP